MRGRMKVVLQDGIMDCGVCCLLSVIRHYGGDVSKEYLRELSYTTKQGVSFYHLIEAAKKIGFTAMGVTGDLSKIDINNLPCLAHVVVNKNYKHFIVIYHIDFLDEKVIVMDPAKGKRVLTFAEFKLMSTTNYIFLQPVKAMPVFVKQKVIWKSMIQFFKDKKSSSFFLLFLTFVYFVFSIFTAFHFKYLLEYTIYPKVSLSIFFISYHLFIMYIVQMITEALRNTLLMKWLSMFDLQITLKTFKQLLSLPYLYYKNRTTGEVITKLKDLTIIKNFLAQFFCSITTDFIGFIVFFLFMLQIHFKLTFCVFGIFFILGVFTFCFQRKKRKNFSRICKREEVVNSYLVESLSNVDTVKGGHIEKSLTDNFFLKYQRLIEENYRYSVLCEIGKSFQQGVNRLLLVFIYGIGSYLVIEEKIGLGVFLIYQSFFSYFLNHGNRIMELVSSYHNFSVSLQRIEDLFVIQNEKFLGSYYYYAYDLIGDICFRNLNYQFGTKIIFSQLNLVIRRGEKILLTGESGSGKSSLVKILMRYLEVPFGMVSIQGIDINHYHLENIRSYITYVSSNEYLFTDSLYNNITLHKEVSEDEFLKVTEITKVNEIVQRKHYDYQMMVEENGFNFSNGERQRIILARSLLKRSNIYIFDEAFGQLDIEKEGIILKEINLFLKDKIVIVISHRLNHSSLFDRVLKLEEGRIHEVKKV